MLFSGARSQLELCLVCLFFVSCYTRWRAWKGMQCMYRWTVMASGLAAFFSSLFSPLSYFMFASLWLWLCGMGVVVLACSNLQNYEGPCPL
ncbi:hypothetical protein QBC46DRAFT_84128 [Diplogelasinospora grovesii]|uniref:Uncharacterized protein n=1 Tax=Diplogelasinospora grovesii TaxID=303347 RepID=A0AAN6NA70_9PEZI|nr:hypothetical protein QBC46DRAFT_84128 [Diplogelasinospora grovesii]